MLQRAWHENQEFLRLCGVGVTGVVRWDRADDADAWQDLNSAARAGVDQYGPILVDAHGPTMAVLALLEQAGVEVEELGTGDVTRACAELQLDVKNCRARHLDQPELNAAVAGVGIRPVGESWVFSAKASTVDVSPLLAVTLAAHGARVAGSVDPMSQIF